MQQKKGTDSIKGVRRERERILERALKREKTGRRQGLSPSRKKRRKVLSGQTSSLLITQSEKQRKEGQSRKEEQNQGRHERRKAGAEEKRVEENNIKQEKREEKEVRRKRREEEETTKRCRGTQTAEGSGELGGEARSRDEALKQEPRQNQKTPSREADQAAQRNQRAPSRQTAEGNTTTTGPQLHKKREDESINLELERGLPYTQKKEAISQNNWKEERNKGRKGGKKREKRYITIPQKERKPESNARAEGRDKQEVSSKEVSIILSKKTRERKEKSRNKGRRPTTKDQQKNTTTREEKRIQKKKGKAKEPKRTGNQQQKQRSRKGRRQKPFSTLINPRSSLLVTLFTEESKITYYSRVEKGNQAGRNSNSKREPERGRKTRTGRGTGKRKQARKRQKEWKSTAAERRRRKGKKRERNSGEKSKARKTGEEARVEGRETSEAEGGKHKIMIYLDVRAIILAA
ncbi:hypothetical protein Tco_0578658 [Tanacetum coccineum]